MKILLKSVKIVDSNSHFNNQTKDILIESQVIKKISSEITENADRIIEGNNLHVSIGWFDLKASFKEPGEEWKETIESGLNAAKKGGFTGLAITPDTKNPIDNRSQVEFILNRANNHKVKLYTYGAISKGLDGKNLAEIGDMHKAGAIGFSDNKNSINSGLLSRALLYAKTFNTKIYVFPYDKSLSSKGIMHEGVTSTKMGTQGIPSLSEEIQVQRDIQIAKYCDTPIHFHTISTSHSVNLIREAKKQGLKVSCDIAAHQLFFTDEDLSSYNSNFKVLPPFRQKKDIESLIEGLKDGTIDAICSDHNPQDIESKKVELEHAKYGIIGLESFFGCINSVLTKHLDLDKIMELITINPRKLIGIPSSTINEGEEANLTIFNPDKVYIFEEDNIASLSKNSPFIGKQLVGEPIEILN